VFAIKPAVPEIGEIPDPEPQRIITRENQICVMYTGDWSEHWGKAILDYLRENECGLEWQCYLGSFIECKMTKQRKPACSRCQFREECRRAARARAPRL
jgi:hypothetical protein